MSFILDIFWAVALSHMAFLSHNCSGEKMPLAEVLEARREQAQPEAQSAAGPSFSTGSRPGSILPTFLPSSAADVQMPAEPADARPRGGRS